MGGMAFSDGPARDFVESPCMNPNCGNADCEKGRRRKFGDVSGTYAETVPSNPYLAAARVEYANSVPVTPELFPADPAGRKAIPIASGVLDYFPAALVEIARVSKAGNDQHNPGEPLHWARGKSMDQDDTIIRHFMERGTLDTDGLRHSAKMAWRALALLQLEMEAAGYPVARGSREA